MITCRSACSSYSKYDRNCFWKNVGESYYESTKFVHHNNCIFARACINLNLIHANRKEGNLIFVKIIGGGEGGRVRGGGGEGFDLDGDFGKFQGVGRLSHSPPAKRILLYLYL